MEVLGQQVFESSLGAEIHTVKSNAVQVLGLIIIFPSAYRSGPYAASHLFLFQCTLIIAFLKA